MDVLRVRAPFVALDWQAFTPKKRDNRPILEALRRSLHASHVETLLADGYSPLHHVLRSRGLVRSGLAAREQLRQGRFFIDGQPFVPKRGFIYFISPEALIQCAEPVPVVTRAAWKLREAFSRWGDLRNGANEARAIDLGASYGGFTQMLLEGGFSRVIAVEVKKGLIDPALRADPRVTAHEGVDAREFVLNAHAEPADLITVDLVTVSLLEILPLLPRLLRPGGKILGIIKPRNEVRVPATVRDFLRVNARDLRHARACDVKREINQREFPQDQRTKFWEILCKKMRLRRANRMEWHSSAKLPVHRYYCHEDINPRDFYEHLFDHTLIGASILGMPPVDAIVSSTPVSTLEMIALFSGRN